MATTLSVASTTTATAIVASESSIAPRLSYRVPVYVSHGMTIKRNLTLTPGCPTAENQTLGPTTYSLNSSRGGRNGVSSASQATTMKIVPIGTIVWWLMGIG